MIPRICRLPGRGSCFLFGPRQTGKSTLVRSLLPARSWTVDLLQHDTFLRYSKDPAQFRLEAEEQVRAGHRTIFIDEIQKVPALLDEVHGLIERTGARFILTGSSARKIKRTGANLLAGRALMRRLHPLTLREVEDRFELDRTLRFGALPAVITGSDEEARELLAVPPPAIEHEPQSLSDDGDASQVHPRPCPCCGSRMLVIEVFARGCEPSSRSCAPEEHRRTPRVIRNDTS